METRKSLHLFQGAMFSHLPLRSAQCLPPSPSIKQKQMYLVLYSQGFTSELKASTANQLHENCETDVFIRPGAGKGKVML